MSNIIPTTSQQIQIITEDRVQLVKDQICKGASDNELMLFINNCNRTGLDPFARQCWAVRRWDSKLQREVFTFQTGVDGFRVIANRSQKYSGQVGPFWCGEDGNWVDVWLSDKFPVASKVGVLRSDFKEPLWAVSKFSSYAAKSNKTGELTQFWKQMPDLMIAKVAECLALRKAFPQDLSGIYSKEEMEQETNTSPEKTKDVTPEETPDSTKIVKAVKPEPVKAKVEVEPPHLDISEPIPDTVVHKNDLTPDISCGVYVVQTGKLQKSALKDLKPADLKRFIALCELSAKERGIIIPEKTQEDIFTIKKFLGLY
jgi:phage recombination protein Bet